MKCSCCGSEITSKDRFCPNCGENNESYVETVTSLRQSPRPSQSQPINQPINRVPIHQEPNYSNQPNNSQVNIYSHTQIVTPVKTEGKALGICALIFSILGGWLGLVLSIVGLCNYKDPENRKLCKIGLGFCIGWAVLILIIGLAG